MGKYEVVILDVDGTLVDSNDAHAHSWVEALGQYGFKVPFAKVRRLIGMGSDKLLPEVTGLAKDDPKGEAITKRRGEIFKERYLADLKPTPQAHDLLQHMHDQGLKLVVASSAKEDELEALLKIVGVDGLLMHQTSSKEAENSKPDPDIIQVALRKAGCPANLAIMVGDTPYDIEAAARSGVATIAVRTGGWEDEDLARAIAIYEDTADFLHHYDSSPLNG